MSVNLLLTLCLFSAPVFSLNPEIVENTCDHLQTKPASTIVDLLVNCRLKSEIGDEKYYNLLGCLLVEDNIIDENNSFNLKAMKKRLPQEILNSSDLTDDYWKIVENCSKEKGKSPAGTAKIIQQCIDSKLNGGNDEGFAEN